MYGNALPIMSELLMLSWHTSHTTLGSHNECNGCGTAPTNTVLVALGTRLPRAPLSPHAAASADSGGRRGREMHMQRPAASPHGLMANALIGNSTNEFPPVNEG